MVIALNRYQQLSLFTEEFGASLEQDFTAFTGSSRIMTMPRHHLIPSVKYLDKILYQLYDHPPENYENLLGTPGVGPSTLRALAMVAEVTHGALPSFQDPVRYTFAHGGKDNYPFPVQRYDLTHSLEVLRTAITKARLGETDKLQAFKKLAQSEEQFTTRS